jgi:hypothetical protein
MVWWFINWLKEPGYDTHRMINQLVSYSNNQLLAVFFPPHIAGIFFGRSNSFSKIIMIESQPHGRSAYPRFQIPSICGSFPRAFPSANG